MAPPLFFFEGKILTIRSAGKTYRLCFAGGNGGQLVMFFPELDMVVNFNGGAHGEAQKFFHGQAFLVPQYIIPAALPEAQEMHQPGSLRQVASVDKCGHSPLTTSVDTHR